MSKPIRCVDCGTFTDTTPHYCSQISRQNELCHGRLEAFDRRKPPEAQAEAGEPVAWMRYLQGDVFQCDKDRDDAFPVYTRPTSSAIPEGVLCEWIEDADGIWQTNCGEGWWFDTGTPSENRAKFCPYCGRIIDAALRGEEGPPDPDPNDDGPAERAHRQDEAPVCSRS